MDVDKVSIEILHMLNPNEYQLYIDYFINKISVTELSIKHDISVTATTTRIYRLKRKIKTLVHSYFMNT